MGFSSLGSQKKDQSQGPNLKCTAHGCPLRWSVESADMNQLCSYHAWEPASKWPRITEELHRIGTWELQRKRKVDTTIYKGHPKAWAMRLKDRHEAGEQLSRFHVECYRVALKMDIAPSSV